MNVKVVTIKQTTILADVCGFQTEVTKFADGTFAYDVVLYRSNTQYGLHVRVPDKNEMEGLSEWITKSLILNNITSYDGQGVHAEILQESK